MRAPFENRKKNLSGKSVVIFGAGYIGTQLAAQAHTAGAHVIALTRNTGHATGLQQLGLQRPQVIQADLASTTWHGQIALTAPIDYIINCVSGGGRAGGGGGRTQC